MLGLRVTGRDDGAGRDDVGEVVQETEELGCSE